MECEEDSICFSYIDHLLIDKAALIKKMIQFMRSTVKIHNVL